MKQTHVVERPEKVILIGVARKGRSAAFGARREEESLQELEQLASSAGARVQRKILQVRDAPDPAYLLGRGKLAEIRGILAAEDTNLLIFDHDLSPTQLRNIERVIDCGVIDRTQLILDIFARHARSREGQLQVELAQLSYLLPRLAGRGTELSRLGGGIGTRGPGEQKLETDRRRIRDRIRKIKQAIETVRRQRAVRRAARQAAQLATVALVGYTNVGKSTLFNALTRAEVAVSDKMFATLDPTIRAIELPTGRRVLLSDTVGFIRDLPHSLISAFRATLEEVQEAAMIVEVSDLSNPHHGEQEDEVRKVLDELGVLSKPRLHVYNKMDLVSPEEQAALHSTNNAVFVSALQETGLDVLLEKIDELLPADPRVRVRLRFPHTRGRELALVHDRGQIRSKRYVDGAVVVEAELPVSIAQRLSAFLAD